MQIGNNVNLDAHLMHANHKITMVRSTLLEKQITVNRTLTVTAIHASAIADMTRAKIVKLLYHKTLTAEQLVAKLTKQGHKKALTTIRHHVNVLRTAGLIDIVRVDETRGGVTKYYGTSTRILTCDIPENFDSKYSASLKIASKELEELVRSLSSKIEHKSIKQKTDPAYTQCIIAEILNRAMTSIMQKEHTT